MVTAEQVKNDRAVKAYIAKADESLSALGYTEHSFAHVGLVANTAKYILETLGYDAHQIELAQIAGYLHDIGNVVNRVDHSQSGAVMAFGNHDEGTGVPVNAVAAALILADKSDVRRSRVREKDSSKFDFHDRVNYSVQKGSLRINEAKTVVELELEIDTAYGSVMDYFEIFMERMILCRKAAEKLGLHFRLTINGQQLL